MKLKHCIAIIVFLLTCTVCGFTQVVVIANKTVPVDTLDKTAVLDLYAGDIRKWGDGQSVVVLDLSEKGDASRSFYKFLGKSSSRMKSIWLKKMLLGEGDPPVVMRSEEEVLQKVAATPGAIGYVRQIKTSRDVKVLISLNGVKQQE